MKEYQQRVTDEKTELDGKIERLDAFLKTEMAQNLPPDENPRMTRQLAVMREYSTILGERIAYFV
jgi:hypothetical protein